MKITIEHYDMVYSAQTGDDATLDKVMGRLIAPLLMSLGYSEKLIDEMFKGGNPIRWDTAYED